MCSTAELRYSIQRKKNLQTSNILTRFVLDGETRDWGNGLQEAGHFALEALYGEEAVRRYWIGSEWNRYDPLAARALIPRGSMKLRAIIERHPLTAITP